MLASVENREFDWVCPECGSDDCEMTAWVHVNSNEICDGEGPGERYWCPTCEDHPRRLVLVAFDLEGTSSTLWSALPLT
jgi:hypothetical protein